MRSFCILVVFLALRAATAQPIADFSIPASACLNQNIILTNLSTNSTDYFWDFNHGDLALPPTAQNLGNLGGNIPYGVEVGFDGTQWIGFIVNKGDNSLLRLNFGDDLNNEPTATVLPGIFGSINPVDIELIHTQNEWFAFVYGSNQLITRLDFGSTLTANPTLTTILSGAGGGDSGLAIEPDGSGWIITYTIGSPSQVGVIKLSDIRAIPGPAEKTIHTINGGSQILGDVKLVKSHDEWFAYTVSYFGTKELLRLTFGTDPLSVPVVSGISGASLSSFSPYGIDIAFDNGAFQAFIATNEGSLFRVNLGEDLHTSPGSIENLTALTVLANTLKIKLQRQGTRWLAFAVNWATNNIYRITFPDPPQKSNIITSSKQSPVITYSSSGMNYVSLTSRSGLVANEIQKSIFIDNKTSPSLLLTTMGVCRQQPVQFESTVDQVISSYQWNFGDGNSASESNPQNIYVNEGQYQVNLVVTSINGCENTVQETIKIYNPPVSVFDSPTGLICTNNEFTFANNTIDNFDGNLIYQWLVNDQPVSTLRDLNYSFTGTGDQSVKLISSIPGCASEATQVISNVQSGPTVGFNVTGVCEEETIVFTNTSTGDISSFSWDFGNTQTSTDINPVQVYSAEGTYPVSLQSVGTNGCVSTTSKNVTIYSKPQTNFAIDLPPFSCAGTPSQFNDLTPAMSDSNITSWRWNFGDANNTSATNKNPMHTYPLAGDYTVSLSVTSNFGCSASIQKSISILPSPVASFTNGIACLNQNVQFVNTSGSGLKASSWNIQSAVYNTTNPPLQRFTAAGNYPVQLTVTAANDCRNTVTKTIPIKLPPQLGFTIDKPCTGNKTLFENTSSGGNDPVASLIWDFPTTQQLGTPLEFEFNQPGIYAVKMNYVGESGCTYAISKNITIEEGPTARFQVSDDVGAAPLAVAFTNESTPDNLSWQWTFKKDAIAIGGSFQRNPNFTFGELGNFSAELFVTNDLNCSDRFVQPIEVVVPRLQVALTNFKLINLTDGTKQAVVTLQNNSNVSIIDPEIILDVSGGPSIKEKVSGKIKPGDQLEKIFSVSILPRSLNFACAEWLVADDEKFDNRKCISLSTEAIVFTPFPNPAASHLYFEWISNSTAAARLSIYNSSGQIVFQQSWETVIVGLNKVDINTHESNLGDGLFYLTFEQAGVKKTFRFLVTKE